MARTGDAPPPYGVPAATTADGMAPATATATATADDMPPPTATTTVTADDAVAVRIADDAPAVRTADDARVESSSEYVVVSEEALFEFPPEESTAAAATGATHGSSSAPTPASRAAAPDGDDAAMWSMFFAPSNPGQTGMPPPPRRPSVTGPRPDTTPGGALPCFPRVFPTDVATAHGRHATTPDDHDATPPRAAPAHGTRTRGAPARSPGTTRGAHTRSPGTMRGAPARSPGTHGARMRRDDAHEDGFRAGTQDRFTVDRTASGTQNQEVYAHDCADAGGPARCRCEMCAGGRDACPWLAAQHATCRPTCGTQYAQPHGHGYEHGHGYGHGHGHSYGHGHGHGHSHGHGHDHSHGHGYEHGYGHAAQMAYCAPAHACADACGCDCGCGYVVGAGDGCGCGCGSRATHRCVARGACCQRERVHSPCCVPCRATMHRTCPCDDVDWRRLRCCRCG